MLKHQSERIMVSHLSEHVIDPGNGAAPLSSQQPSVIMQQLQMDSLQKMQTIKKIRNVKGGVACSAGASWYIRGINKENKSLTQELSKAPLACLARD